MSPKRSLHAHSRVNCPLISKIDAKHKYQERGPCLQQRKCAERNLPLLYDVSARVSEQGP